MSRAHALIGLLASFPAAGQEEIALAPILPLEARAAIVDGWLEKRLENLVPLLMRREGIDLWIVSGRENDEDPVLATMLPATWLQARRRTILAFHDLGEERGVERFSVSRYDVGGLFPGAWNPAVEPDQWKRLASLVAERDPDKIGIDRSLDFAHADGLSSTEYEALRSALPERLRGRVVSAEKLAVGWLETRSKEELAFYPALCALTHRIMSEGFATVRPGVTTIAQLEWWYRERIEELHLETWFHPAVDLQRAGSDPPAAPLPRRNVLETIQPGDLVHLDFGITYLRLSTDTQQLAYVLRPGEGAPPAGLVRALAAGNRLQDLLTSSFQTGRTGNQILAATLALARSEGIECTIYSHPLGFHGHGAGPYIGMWDRQDGVPGPGEFPLRADTAYAIELAAVVGVPEWSAKVRIQLEEDAWFDGQSVRYFDGRQTALYLIAAE